MSSASTGGTEGSSPASSPASAASLAMAAPKYGTLVPNRIFVGGISASTSEAELAQLFSTYGNVKATKIILDRAGVSKGYGFVTFETEAEAKRLQQEPESIVLRERKLNIAPAIKKQLFNRSFDGSSGSPPAVPTSTYYYANGMGLTYQNGMTFYNTGAPAPATPVAPPSDPATLYQTTSVFGPQATAGHQTFAPMMYPCPAPSLYVPQQYQYSPMPYEPYYAGAAAGAPQYLYTTSGSQSTTNGGGTTSGCGTNGTGATSPPVGPQPALTSLPAPPQTHHFYAPAAPPPHHPQVPAGPPQPQVDHLYYSFAAGLPPPPPPHASIGIGDQQLLLYTTDASCQQQQSNDPQVQQQEDSQSTSSHSEYAGGNETQVSGASLVPLVPIKFPIISNRFITTTTTPTAAASYYPIAIHHTPNLHGSQNCLNDNNDGEANSIAQMHCRTIVYHPATVYIPHNHHASSQYHHPISSSSSLGGGPSLLPTPTPASVQQPHHHHHASPSIQNNLNPKLQTIISSSPSPSLAQRDYNKSLVASANAQGSYNLKSQNLSIALISSGIHHHHHGGGRNSAYQTQKYSNSSDFPKFGSNFVSSAARFPNHHQYKKSSLNSGGNVGSTTYFSGQRSAYGYHKASMSLGNVAGVQVFKGLNYPNTQKIVNYQNFETFKSGNYNYNSDQYFDTRSKTYNQKHISSLSSAAGQYKNQTTNDKRSNNIDNNSTVNQNSDNLNSQNETQNQNSNNSSSAPTVVNEKSSSPPPAPYSPMTRPLPTLSPPIPQVQFYAPAQNRYQTSTSGHQHQHQQQQQQQTSQRRYTVAPSLPAGRKPSDKYSGSGGGATSQSSILRQHKYNKSNGLMQSGSGKTGDDSLGGAGDAPPGVGRIPITPPGTPRNNNHHSGHSNVDQNQINDSCSHQMQALSL